MFLLFAIVLASPGLILAWVNDYDQHFRFKCPVNQVIKNIESIHDNGREDRRFDFTCAKLSIEDDLTNCQWQEWANTYDAVFAYQCPGEGVIAGVESIHDNAKEDRRFKFYCCQPGSYVSHGCVYTQYVNHYDQHFSFRVPYGLSLRGVVSVHRDQAEDRLFKFNLCKLGALNVGK